MTIVYCGGCTSATFSYYEGELEIGDWSVKPETVGSIPYHLLLSWALAHRLLSHYMMYLTSEHGRESSQLSTPWGYSLTGKTVVSKTTVLGSNPSTLVSAKAESSM
ncbi:hypothetical protein [Bacillus phage CP-51]|uniref:Uncharacterized protein n=1 Tax=Bacillus phage CP-51 TaxID=1391188 RepID=A0A068EP62_9CAUD|nr:hypothetical protein OZ73_gp004 [Bacillus phage CP-51]AID50439.1 hypothetical protein [Bacillus phage CP-51]